MKKAPVTVQETTPEKPRLCTGTTGKVSEGESLPIERTLGHKHEISLERIEKTEPSGYPDRKWLLGKRFSRFR